MTGHSHSHQSDFNKVSAAGLLIALGIIYGDIGTSPLYVMKAIVGEGHQIQAPLILGGLSCVFWTITLQTTVKYVILTLRADNNGEGGIFALYALVRKRATWLYIPAIIGGSTLLADGIITPPISVASAIEGLRILYPSIDTIPIILAILSGLFLLQAFGTKTVGRLFGPLMLLWFGMLAVLGITHLIKMPQVLSALNPYYAWQLLTQYPDGFWILGAVFLCTTGAEALYSDLGHCGRGNIRVSWVFVKSCLLLNYFGQGAWLLSQVNQPLTHNPFYALMPEWFLLPGICIATLAAIIASQALISGSFTLIGEAMRLSFWPQSLVRYPTEVRGQLYIPSINWLLWTGCVVVVLYFRESSSMEAAYGLAITVTMLVTTILLSCYLYSQKFPIWVIGLFLLVYLSLEGSFLIANLDKFPHGGWVSVAIGLILASIMYIFIRAHQIKSRLLEFVSLPEQIPGLRELSNDITIPKYGTHLVFMTAAGSEDRIEKNAIESIFLHGPKRADIYWFIHVETLDEPYTKEYKINVLAAEDVIKITFRLGFRVEPTINLFFRQVLEDIVQKKEVDIISRYESLHNKKVTGDFTFIIFEPFLSYDNDLPLMEQVVMKGYFFLKQFTLSKQRWFQLEANRVTVEKVPMVIRPLPEMDLVRVEEPTPEKITTH
ncbi:KUP/HAK/KT family potassium transporter [Xanthocytophaga agilis]|uniref:Probable potassium transport system protein Kup n=1 Tax=Xanthocytophaga agilis TaxID=3048010 RepID=A0AAE3UFV3_9BACT|nr:KUP/HAK/KT family potassium transporter [Xanthocytophaga agilis]MDJ1504253.1 KUP/HAK/KT family potassium transporter [Xanthocytophaga agilis]